MYVIPPQMIQEKHSVCRESVSVIEQNKVLTIHKGHVDVPILMQYFCS